MFTPMGLIMRLFGSDPMHRRPDPKAASYRLPRKERPVDKSVTSSATDSRKFIRTTHNGTQRRDSAGHVRRLRSGL
jgi:hypothetical protein